MTDREFFLQTMEDEFPRFERAFNALPTDKLDYRPHPKSRSAIELVDAMTALEACTFETFLTTGKLDFLTLKSGQYTTTEAAWKAFSEAMKDAKQIVSGMSEADWNSEAVMSIGGKNEWKTTKGNMAWALALDLIHHRGQLSVYIRPMGGKVPSIYGPSGDSEG
jgi:uncharacterized damage-inducible protein DinB